jgi:hypothetical protein
MTPVAAGVVAAGLAAATGGRPKDEKAVPSAFLRDFDSEVAVGVCQHFAPKTGTGIRPHLARVRPEGHEFKIFHVEGDIPPDQLKKLLEGLKGHLAECVRANKAVTATETKDAIADRPIYLLLPNFLPPGMWVQPDTARGFYFGYKEEKVEGAVDVLAVRVAPSPGADKGEWRVVGAVHEPAAP